MPSRPETNKATIEEARRLIGKCVLFRGLDAQERNIFLARTRTRNYVDGETIFEMGMPGETIMALLTGSVRIRVTSPDGKELVLAILEPGDIFGGIAVLDGKERSANATAVGQCSLAVLERRDVLSFLSEHPRAWIELVEVLCERLRRADELLAEIALLQVPTCLAKAVLRVAKPIPNSDVHQNTSMQVQLTQRELANLVGATRESVNKCLRGWQRAGIVRVEEGWIKIQDELSLTRLAELDQQ
jgi:CRP/FNR family cyclic AMP-dependent transcriptional regulator